MFSSLHIKFIKFRRDMHHLWEITFVFFLKKCPLTSPLNVNGLEQEPSGLTYWDTGDMLVELLKEMTIYEP